MRWWLLGVLCWTGPVWGADPAMYPESGVQVFLGLDDTSAPTQVQDGRAQDLQNVNLSVSKDLRQRFGIDLVLTPDGTNGLEIGDTLDVSDEAFCGVTGVYYTKFSSGTERIISICGSRLYYLNGTASWDQVNGSAITAGSNNQFVFTTALD